MDTGSAVRDPGSENTDLKAAIGSIPDHGFDGDQIDVFPTRTRSSPDPAAALRPDGAGHRRRGARLAARARPAGRGDRSRARDPKTGGAGRLPHFAPKAKRVIFLHQSGGPSQLETFDYKPALAKYQGTQIPDSVRKGQRVAQTMGQSIAAGRALAVRVRAARQVGHVGQRAAAAHREDRRRHHRHQDDEHRGDQPRPGDHVHPDRLSAAGPAEHGRVAQLRPGQREPEPAGVRRAALAGARDQRRPAAVRAAVGQRLPAVERIRACGFGTGSAPVLYLEIRRASTRRRAGAMLDAVDEAEHDEARRVRRSGDRDPHRPVRDGVSDADLRAGADRSVEGAGLGLRAVRPGIAQARAPSPPTACWPAGWPSATSGSSSSITAAGTSTTICRAIWRCSARTPTSRPRRSSPT